MGSRLTKGLDVEILFQGRSLAPAQDGYLGTLGAGELTFDILIDKGAAIYPFAVRNPGRVLIGVHTPSRYAYRHSITIHPRGPAQHPNNSLRFLTVAPMGKIEIWELGIVRQLEQIVEKRHLVSDFAIFQKNYSLQCYRDMNGEAVCPYFKSYPAWTYMNKFLATVLNSDRTLPSLSTYVPPPSLTFDDIKEGRGRVEWYNCLRGSGKVTVRDQGRLKEARVNWQQIKSTERFVRLACPVPGTSMEPVYVEYGKVLLLSSKRPQEFRWTLLEVRV